MEIEKQKCHFSKNGIHLDKRDTNKLIISEGFTFGQNGSKYFVGYKIMKNYTFARLNPTNEGICKEFRWYQDHVFFIRTWKTIAKIQKDMEDNSK